MDINSLYLTFMMFFLDMISNASSWCRSIFAREGMQNFRIVQKKTGDD